MKDKNQVFVVSLAITIIMAIWAVAFNANFTVVSNAAYSFLTNNFGWLYLMAMTAFVIFPLQLLSVNGERLSWDRMTPSRNIPLFPGLPCCLGLAWVWVWYSGEYLSLWRIFQAQFPELRLARKPLQTLPYGPATCTGDFIRGQTIVSLDWALPISSSARENRALSVPYLNP